MTHDIWVFVLVHLLDVDRFGDAAYLLRVDLIIFKLFDGDLFVFQSFNLLSNQLIFKKQVSTQSIKHVFYLFFAFALDY